MAKHESIVLRAFKYGVLPRLTVPIHTFLPDGASIRSDVTDQYREDLKEKWLLAEEELERHRRARKYFGKLAELLVAFWMKAQSFRIEGLEATGTHSDIVASDPYR